MWVRRALGAASAVPVAVTLHDLVVSVHTLREDETACVRGVLAPHDMVLVNRLSGELRAGDVLLVRCAFRALRACVFAAAVLTACA
jgi:hypothetical protein